MPSHEGPYSGEEGTRALEAVRLGSTLDADHRADPGALRSIGTCRMCGILSYQANDGVWKHVPAIDECTEVENWIRQHRQIAPAHRGHADDRYS
jgi:hypothetical protein